MIAPRAPQPEPAEVAFFMTLLTQEQEFKASKTFAKRTLIPGSYTLRVELLLAGQRRAIGDAIRREYGLPRDARVLLGKLVIQIGTPAEVAAHDKAWNLELRQRLAQYQGIQQRLIALEAEVRRSGLAPSPEVMKGFLQRFREARLQQDDVVSLPGHKGPYTTLTQVRDAQAAAIKELRQIKFTPAQAHRQRAAAFLQQAQKALP